MWLSFMWIYARLLLSLCFVLLLYTTYCSRSLLIPVYRVELEEIGKFNLWLVSGDLLSRQKSTLLLVRESRLEVSIFILGLLSLCALVRDG